MTDTERRLHPRQEAEIAVTICKDDEKITATLIDISQGGIAIASERGLFRGTEVDITVDYIEDYTIHGTVRWVYLAQADGKTIYRIGIEADRVLAAEDIVEATLPGRSGGLIEYREGKIDEITWDQRFSVGIQKFDEQHKRIILMINRLIKGPQATTESETVSGLLIEMTQYAGEHFALEEKLMKEYNYPEREAHINQHTDFRKKTVDFCLAVMNKEESIAQNILRYLSDWLVNHILKVDMACSTFLQEHAVGPGNCRVE